jgi:hypothetical protein
MMLCGLVISRDQQQRKTVIFYDFSKAKIFNPNDLQFRLKNALQRIQRLESASISPINNQSSTNSSGNSGLTLTEELRRSFPSLANPQPNHTLIKSYFKLFNKCNNKLDSNAVD